MFTGHQSDQQTPAAALVPAVPRLIRLSGGAGVGRLSFEPDRLNPRRILVEYENVPYAEGALRNINGAKRQFTESEMRIHPRSSYLDLASVERRSSEP